MIAVLKHKDTLGGLRVIARKCVLPLVAALALAAAAGTAVAAEYTTYSGKLGPKEWSCAKCFVQSGLTDIINKINTEGATGICAGPVQYNGSKWVYPYGWNCSSNVEADMVFPAITASEGIDDPGSHSYTYSGQAW